MNTTHAALLPHNFRPYVHCTINTDRESCNLDPNACSCDEYPEAAEVNCSCYNHDFERFFSDKTRALPLDLPNIKIFQQNLGIAATVTNTPLNLVLELNDRLVVEDVRAICQVKARVSGCYNCRTGGRIFYTCHSSFGNVTATILCRDYSHWQARCTPGGISDSVVLSWEGPVVSTTCEVECGHSPTEFSLNGTLVFLQNADENWMSIEKGLRSSTASNISITLPPLDFIWSQGMGSWKQQALAVLAAIGCFAIFYCFTKCTPLGTAFLALLYSRTNPAQARAARV